MLKTPDPAVNTDAPPKSLASAEPQIMDGKLVLLPNVQDMSAVNVVRRYKSLADIERGFKVLKSEIEIAPVFHRFPERIKVHASAGR